MCSAAGESPIVAGTARCLRVTAGRCEAPLQQRFCRSQCCSLCFVLLCKAARSTASSDQILVGKRVNIPVQKMELPFALWERGAVPAARPPKRPVSTSQSRMPCALLCAICCCSTPSLAGRGAACHASAGSPGTAAPSAWEDIVVP